MRNRDFVWKISLQGESGESLSWGSEWVKNLLRVNLYSTVWDNWSIFINWDEIHTILKRNNIKLLAHSSLSFINEISFLNQTEIFYDLQRTFNSLNLDSKILEFVNLTGINVCVHAFNPNVARGYDLGFCWHFYNLRLDDFLKSDIVLFGKNKPNLSFNQRN